MLHKRRYPESEGREASQVPLTNLRKTYPWTGWVDKATDFDISKAFDEKPPPRLPRKVIVNGPLPDEAWAHDKKGQRLVGKKPALGWEFSSNQTRTSKYTVFTFLPRNLLEQFRRIANIFFLALVILQFIPRFQLVSPALAALPLLVVLGITALKDGYEDVKRRQADVRTNNQPVSILHAPGVFTNPNLSRSKKTGWSIPFRKKDEGADEAKQLAFEIDHPDEGQLRKKHHWWSRKHKVGGKKKGDRSASSTIRGRRLSQPYPEDVDGDACFRTTAWEDLRVGDFVKLRSDESVPADVVICATSEEENICYIETKNLDGETNLKSRHAITELQHLRGPGECARAKFYVDSEAPDSNMFRYSAAVVLPHSKEDSTSEEARIPVDLNTVLLRGTVVRNTDWVIGLVVFTGRDTKIVMNSSGTPSKRSKVERQMNPMVFMNLGLLAAMCSFNAIASHFFTKFYHDRNSYWTVGMNRSTDNVNIEGAIAFANAMITYQNIVPISLYISIEAVRTVQAAFIWADNNIYYAPNKRRTLARSWNLSDDLGQIQYIFSDKTGTLTQNSMQFRMCSISGKVYHGDLSAEEQKLFADHQNGIPEEPAVADSESDESATRVGNHSTSVPSPPIIVKTNAEGKDEIEMTKPKKTDHRSDEEKLAILGPGADKKMGNSAEIMEPFKDATLIKDLEVTDSAQARTIHGFFATLALCHTVLATEDEDGVIQYKAQSPDESALVQAAADVGFVFRGRDHNILRLQTPHDTNLTEYELLEVIEFSSARKRMSVIVRKLDTTDEERGGELFLLCKGADNVIFERLASGQEEMKLKTDETLEEFASEGLRTLCLAYRNLSEDEYSSWAKRYQVASATLEHREEHMNKVQDEIETGLRLLGATAIEDKLQDGVPEAIADLKRAGIKVWVATGDKLETAIAIAKSCNLIARDMNLIIVRGGAYEEKNSTYAQLRKALLTFFQADELLANLASQPPGHVSDEKVPGSPMPSRRSRSGGRFSLERTTTGVSGISDLVGDDNGQRPGGYGLVIDGASLQHAFREPFTKEILLELSTRCQAVVCCRTSPMQKAEIVRLIKNGVGAMCLAIGDGANDVSMIQAADVGVGVAGEEGLQAVNASDYAIGQFRFLVRLLLVHGHWSYVRNSSMIVNFFYKEIIGIAVLFFFQFFCGYSTTTVYEYTYLLLFNIIFTLLPVLAIGIFDQDIRQRVLMQVPELYKHGRDGTLFGMHRFAIYMIDGIYQGAVCFFFIYFTYNTTASRGNGYDPGLYEMSTVMITAVIFAVNIYQGLNMRLWNWISILFILIGPAVILLWTSVYSAIAPGWIWTYVYGNNHRLWPSIYYWFGCLLCIALSLLPRFTVKFYQEMYFPTDAEILRIVDRAHPEYDYRNDPHMPYLRDQIKYGERGTPRASIGTPRPSFDRTRTSMSITHDMSSGQQVRPGRGFIFDQADGMGETAVGGALRRFTSNQSSQGRNSASRPRSRSIRIGNVELGFPSMGSSSKKSSTPPNQQGLLTPEGSTSTPRRNTLLGRMRAGSWSSRDSPSTSPRGSRIFSEGSPVAASHQAERPSPLARDATAASSNSAVPTTSADAKC